MQTLRHVTQFAFMDYKNINFNVINVINMKCYSSWSDFLYGNIINVILLYNLSYHVKNTIFHVGFASHNY